MRRLTSRDLALFSALLICFYVFDVPRLLIEIWGLPLPVLGGRPPYLLPLVTILLVAMLANARRDRDGAVLHPSDLVFAAALMVVAALSTYHGMGQPKPAFGLVVDLALFYSGFVLVRAYRDAFGSSWPVVDCAFWMALAIAAVHFVLLLMALGGLPPLGAQPGEVLQRNGISFLLVYACFYAWFLRRNLPPVVAHGILPLFALVQFYLNGSRSALIVLMLLGLARYLLKAHVSLRGGQLALCGAIVALFAVAAGLVWLQQWGGPLLGADDDRLSVVSRFATNYELLQLALHSPIIGIGEAAATGVSFAGYPSHTFPVILLAAFGTVGALPVVVALWQMATAEVGPGPRPLMTLTWITLSLLFVNDLWPWLAVAVAGAGLAERPVRAEPAPSRAGRAIETAVRGGVQ